MQSATVMTFTANCAVLCFSIFLLFNPAYSIKPKAQCCPSRPSELCDFYFDGYKEKLPTFYLDDGINSDHLLIPVRRSEADWAGSMDRFSPIVYSTISGKPVFISSTNLNATFLTCPIPLPSWMNGGNQFYLSGSQDNLSRLFVRTWQKQTILQWGMKYYADRCVHLPITAASLETEKGHVNLNPGDGNTEFPEYRRCVTFLTEL